MPTANSHCLVNHGTDTPTHNDPVQHTSPNWGDSIGHATNNTALRIATININGLPKDTSHPKNATLREALGLHHIDIIGMSEINIKWDRIHPSNRFKQRTSKWWEHCHCSYSYNYRDLSTATYQPGGTAILSLHSTSHRVLNTTLSDPTGLGRWTSTLYAGKQNIQLRIIQVYCPPVPSPLSHNSAYTQHQRYFLTKQVTDCPRALFLQHLSQFLNECIIAQEQIILMGDFNHIVDSAPLLHVMSQHHLHNLHHTLHPSYHTHLPTYERGTRTIDAIFASPTIKATRAGFLSFKTFPTDHRLIWCDIDFNLLFGSPRLTIIPHSRRRLKCEDPRSVKKFCSAYQHLLASNNLIQAASTLHCTSYGPLTMSQQIEYERIDKLRVKYILQAEKKCRKFKMGGIEFSPKVQHQRNRIHLWKNVLSKKKGGKLSTSLLTRLEKRVGVSRSLSYSLSDIKAELSDAFSKYKALIKPSKGSDLRDEWIETLAAAKAAVNQTTLASELLLQRQKEKQRQAFRAIKWSTRTSDTNAAITQVTENVNGHSHLHSSKEAVETAILTANDAKYRQTVDTPPMSFLLPDLGFLGNTQPCIDILNGRYIPCTPLDPYSKALFAAFQKPPNLPSISTAYTPEEYVAGWKKMKEKTSSGLSGIHFGHHKACAQNSCLAQFESIMCGIPYRTGYSPLRYQKSVNTMLKKKQNKIAADQLRTILLLEADFNHLNKKMGRDLMHQAERFNLIAPEQFGSRKSHSCIDQVIIKRLYYDALRFQRRSGFLCSNDAKACYDRIVHSIASLAMQRVGMPIEPILCMLRSLQKMTHYVRTAHGLSTNTYGCSLNNGKPVQGSGQGNGASPTIWTLISSPLLTMMRKLNFGVTFSSPLSKEAICFVGCSFVDDTDLLQTSPSLGESVHQFQHRMQQAINAWSSGLRATGGALVPHKSWIYPIEFSFDAKGDYTYTPINQLDLQFTVPDSQQQRCPLEQINPNEAKETLGVFLAPDGNETAQINYLRTKVASWVDRVRSNHLSKHHAKLALTSTIYKTLEYPVAALTITQQQWRSITAPLHKCGLQINGVCSTIPVALREGASDHMALELKCMYKQQEIHKLEKYLHFREHAGLVGQMIRLNEELLKVELGLPGNIFAANYSLYHPLATDSWIKSIWKFLFQTQIKITMRTPPLQATKINDTFLMEAFQANGYKHSQLRCLNTCRKYLQVTTLGDITIADGSVILPDIKAGNFPSASSSTLTWPRQQSPDDQSWKLWRKALKGTFESQGSVLPHLRSDAWEPTNTRRFNWYYHPHHNTLFHRLPANQWQLYRFSIRRGRTPAIRLYHRTATILRTIPAHSIPSPVIHTAPHRVQLRRIGRLIPSPPRTPHTSFDEFVHSQYPRYEWVLTSLQGLDHLDHIIHAIRQGNCAMISDGSFQTSTSKQREHGFWVTKRCTVKFKAQHQVRDPHPANLPIEANYLDYTEAS